jgi:cell wall-associated NlpC family hydrolase
MARRLVLLVLLGLVPAGAALGAKPTSWAAAEIRLLGQDPTTFRADDTVTRGELAELLAPLAPAAPAKPEVPLTMQDLDARLVAALGLSTEAQAFAAAAKAAGLAPPARFGTEVVARLLTLRTNHPAKADVLERLPTDPAPRAEAAYSAAQIVRFHGWEVTRVREAATTFALPPLNDWQRRILTTAVKLVGYPYIWAGTSDRAQVALGKTVPGGYDCSGFVWRVYKLQAYAGAGALAAALRGRTTYAMSGEVPKARRIPAVAVQPADVVFFGAKGPKSKPAEVDHMGIYLGNGWFVHSSRYGVALETLTGWYQQRFAWARRPLLEAGLMAQS